MPPLVRFGARTFEDGFEDDLAPSFVGALPVAPRDIAGILYVEVAIERSLAAAIANVPTEFLISV